MEQPKRARSLDNEHHNRNIRSWIRRVPKSDMECRRGDWSTVARHDAAGGGRDVNPIGRA